MSKDPNEPILRKEYERRHEGLHRKYDTFSHRVGRTLAVFAVAILLTGGAAAWLYAENARQAGDIEATLVESCETSGNSLRAATAKFGEVLAGQVQDSVRQSKAFEASGTYTRLFPSTPPGELHALLAKSRAEKLQDKDEILRALEDLAPVDCRARFR